MLDVGNGRLMTDGGLLLSTNSLAPSDEGAVKNLRFLTEGEKKANCKQRLPSVIKTTDIHI